MKFEELCHSIIDCDPDPEIPDEIPIALTRELCATPKASALLSDAFENETAAVQRLAEVEAQRNDCAWKLEQITYLLTGGRSVSALENITFGVPELETIKNILLETWE